MKQFIDIPSEYRVIFTQGPRELTVPVTFPGRTEMTAVIAAARKKAGFTRRYDAQLVRVDSVARLFGQVMAKTVYVPQDGINGAGTIGGALSPETLAALKASR